MSEAQVTPRFKKQDETDPDAYMMKAKEGLEKQREDVLAKRATFDEELAAIDAKLSRIESYFNPTKPPEPPKNARIPRPGSGPRKPRQSGVRDGVLAEIAKHKDGIKRGDLLTAMGATEKSAEQSISNAVSALKKDGKITADQGLYKAA